MDSYEILSMAAETPETLKFSISIESRDSRYTIVRWFGLVKF